MKVKFPRENLDNTPNLLVKIFVVRFTFVFCRTFEQNTDLSRLLRAVDSIVWKKQKPFHLVGHLHFDGTLFCVPILNHFIHEYSVVRLVVLVSLKIWTSAVEAI